MLRQYISYHKLQWRSLSDKVLRSQQIQGPTFFQDPNAAPLPYNTSLTSVSENGSRQDSKEPVHNIPADKSKLKDFANLLATLALAYLALDNYQGRLKAEKLNQETTAINVKTLKAQQQNYLKALKSQDIKTLKERIEVQKRCFRMSMHIALLKKQLIDLGVDPKDISDVSEEFNKHVKITNSRQNLTSTAIWLDDSTEYKGLVPDYREYDRNT